MKKELEAKNRRNLFADSSLLHDGCFRPQRWLKHFSKKSQNTYVLEDQPDEAGKNQPVKIAFNDQARGNSGQE
ncbi:MAG: hypothetical protein U0Z53_06280 [Blastocatellia bacterium]